MIKRCMICEDEFETKSSRRKICYKKHIRKCLICGNEFELKTWPYNQQVCSNKNCKAQRVRQLANNITKHCKYCGAEFVPSSPRQKYCTGTHYSICKVCGSKFKVSNLASIPVTCSSKCSQILREQTMMIQYGVKNIMKLDSMKESFKENNLKKYGVPYIFQSNDFKEQRNLTLTKRYDESRMESDDL